MCINVLNPLEMDRITLVWSLESGDFITRTMLYGKSYRNLEKYSLLQPCVMCIKVRLNSLDCREIIFIKI